MKSLYLRIYLTVVLALALFAVGSAWLFQREVQVERGRFDEQAAERAGAWAELIQRSLPPADAPREEQAQALREWAQRLRLPIALDDEQGQRIAASEAYLRRHNELPGAPRGVQVKLDDGRTMWVLRNPLGGPRANAGPVRRAARHGGAAALAARRRAGRAAGGAVPGRGCRRLPGGAPPDAPPGRLEARRAALRRGRARPARDAADGRDEVAAVAASFNQAAERIELLVNSHKNLLANASHELRSPLARMKMALSLMESRGTDAAQRERLASELRTNIGELDALVEEVLLASRLDAQAAVFTPQPVDVIALAAEEAAQVGAELQAVEARLERARRRAPAAPRAAQPARKRASATAAARSRCRRRAPARPVELRVCDRGPGVPQELRERIFEPFFRLPGHAEREGGVGLGLALVKQIAQRHGGTVRCEANAGGGSCFVLSLPAA